MQILPNEERFSGIEEADVTRNFTGFFSDLTEEQKAEAVIARSDSKAALKKLQDDLRKAGYKKVK